jgi:hypothetical protein
MREFIPHLVLMLVGGLGSSVGLGQFAQSGKGRAILGASRGWAMGLFTAVSLASMGGAGWWMVRRVLNAADASTPFGSPLVLFAFGLAIGLPMSLPQVLSTWNQLRPEKIAAREKRAAEATREDREEYAVQLAEQIRDAAAEPRPIEAFTRGKEGKVLWLEGELARDEGERLVAALRRELSEVGFTRVEARGGKGNWWTKV